MGKTVNALPHGKKNKDASAAQKLRHDAAMQKASAGIKQQVVIERGPISTEAADIRDMDAIRALTASKPHSYTIHMGTATPMIVTALDDAEAWEKYCKILNLMGPAPAPSK